MNTPLALLSGSPGWGEILVVFVVVLVLFGPRRLPELARMIGKALEELRRASRDFRDEVMRIDTDVKDGLHDAVYTPPTGSDHDFSLNRWDPVDDGQGDGGDSAHTAPEHDVTEADSPETSVDEPGGQQDASAEPKEDLAG